MSKCKYAQCTSCNIFGCDVYCCGGPTKPPIPSNFTFIDCLAFNQNCATNSSSWIGAIVFYALLAFAIFCVCIGGSRQTAQTAIPVARQQQPSVVQVVLNSAPPQQLPSAQVVHTKKNNELDII